MNKRIPILVGLALVASALWFITSSNHFISLMREQLDNFSYDMHIRTRAANHTELTSSTVVIVDIDEKSVKTLGHRPWPRSKLATMVNQLQRHGAAVIAFDIFFPENEISIATSVIDQLKAQHKLSPTITNELKRDDVLFTKEDKLFAKSIAAAKAILPVGFVPRAITVNELPPPLQIMTPKQKQEFNLIKEAGFISNIPVLQHAAKATGFINIYADSDDVVRRIPLLIDYHHGIYAALALQAISLYTHQPIQILSSDAIKIGPYTIPMDDSGQVLIPFVGKSYSFPYYSAIDVIKNQISTKNFAGKIVLIGSSATGVGDLHTTAVQSPFPGMEIQATLINGILENILSIKPGWAVHVNVALALILGLLAALIFPYLGPRMLGAVMILLPLSIILMNSFLWVKTGNMLSLAIPNLLIILLALVNIVYGYLFETRRRERLKSIFGQYVPEKHIDEMLKSSEGYALHGESRDMSVLFADIRHFTAISENLTAEDLVIFLNTFFTPMTEIVYKNQGTVDKFIGDLIMAFWGAPLRDEDHARHAVETALEMQSKVTELQSSLIAQGWPAIKIGIGINSGIMNVGDMGSQYRRNYTVLGDSVNLASRLEGLTSYYGVKILATEATKETLTDYVFRHVDRVKVKGKKNNIDLYEVIGKAADITSEQQQTLAIYHRALAHYFNQEWSEAYPLIQELHQRYPDEKLYSIFYKRISEYQRTPPSKKWNGVFVHTSK